MITSQATVIQCDEEPIHIPGSVQAYGALLVVGRRDGVVRQASANAAALLGVPGKTLQGLALNALIRKNAEAPVSLDVVSDEPQWARAHASANGAPLDVMTQGDAEVVSVELEAAPRYDEEAALAAQDYLQQSVTRLYRAQDLTQLCRITCEAVHALSRFDRVMIYRFDSHWNGEVIAETLADDPDIVTYLGHHFPASDIPPQARAVFEKNWMRIIPDVNFQLQPLEPQYDPHTRRPFDMSGTLLRSPSPVHLEYLRNMQVGASLTLSLLRNGKLWGLVACHHRTPRYLPWSVRAACEQLGRIASTLLASKEQEEDAGYREALRSVHHALAHNLRTQSEFSNALTRSTPNLLDLAAATGAAAHVDGRWLLLGKVPSIEQMEGILRWLKNAHPNDEVVQTSNLTHSYPAAGEFAASASGLLALQLPQAEENYILWFRAEVLQTLTWAGEPAKRYDRVGDTLRIHPRKSFAAWQEIVRNCSLPWRPAEIEAVSELRKTILELDLQRQFRNEKAARAGIEAERARFAYLSDASAVLMSSLNIQDCLQRFAKLLVGHLCDWCVIYLREEDAWKRVVMAHSTAQGQAVLEGLSPMPGLDVKPMSPLADAFREGSAMCEPRVLRAWIETISPSPAYAALMTDRLGLESLICAPMKSRGKVVGMLKLVRAQRVNRYTPDDLRLAVELARRAAHAVENAQLYCDASDALQARDHVLGVVSHDLKTPLGAIQLSAEGLRRRLAKVPNLEGLNVDTTVDRILNSSRRMQGLIEDVLNLGKIEAGSYVLDREQVPLQKLFDDAYNMLEPLAAAKQVQLQVDNPYANQTLSCDPDRLMQVFSNLVGNAIKFTPAEGQVTMAAPTCDAHEVCLTVKDTGPGIDPEDMPRIFDRYWQATRAARQGAGLGLFIARGIVEAHGGRLEVESKINHGTMFKVFLPREAPATPPSGR